MPPVVVNIQGMSQYNANGSCRNEHENKLFIPNLVQDKAGKAQPKQQQGRTLMMMMPVAMPQRKAAQHKRNGDHGIFDQLVFQYLESPQGKAADKQGKQGAMNGAGNGSGNAQFVVVEFPFHKISRIVSERRRYNKCNIIAKD